MKKRNVCSYPDCKCLARKLRKDIRGQWLYRTMCERHRKLGIDDKLIIEKIENKKCERCGWDKAYCDRHRIVKEKGYIKENIIILCPNCHREEESKKRNQGGVASGGLIVIVTDVLKLNQTKL